MIFNDYDYDDAVIFLILGGGGGGEGKEMGK